MSRRLRLHRHPDLQDALGLAGRVEVGTVGLEVVD